MQRLPISQEHRRPWSLGTLVEWETGVRRSPSKPDADRGNRGHRGKVVSGLWTPTKRLNTKPNITNFGLQRT